MELRESEERLSLAAGAAGLGLWMLDLATGTIWASLSCRRLLGLPEGGGVSIRQFRAAFDPADRRKVREALGGARADAGDFELECRLAAHDGSPRWTASRGRVEFDADGRQVRVRGVTLDITARRLAEEAERDLSGKLIRAQEDERARLARELHDDLTQRLAALAIDAGQGGLRASGTADGATLRGLRNGLVRLSEDVHALSYRLHPSIL